MKQVFTFLFSKKSPLLLLVICFLLTASSTIAQVTATLDYESSSNGATTFSAGGINFSSSGRFAVAGAPNTTLGANNSHYFLATNTTASQTAGTITITTGATSFKINSFAAYAASDLFGNNPVAGTITFT